MKITSKALKEIAEDINRKVKDSHITNIFLLNSNDIVFSFSFYRDEKLLISLNHANPFVAFINKTLTSPTILNKTNEFLRKEVKDSVVKGVEVYNDDRILLLHLENRDEFYQKHIYKMIIELIPHRSNLILLDQDNKILFATTYTSLESSRQIIKGFTYPELEKSNDNQISESFDYKEYLRFANEYLETSFENRKKEKYKTLYTHLKSKVSSLKRKIKDLNNELKEAEKATKYKEIGDTLYAYLNIDEQSAEEYIKTLPDYEASFSISDNAQRYFKKYKKAMRGKEQIANQILLAEASLNEKELLLNAYPFMDEDELLELSKEYLKTSKKGKPTPAYLPSYVLLGKTKIGYGKNTKQNEYLSFKLAKPNQYYFHIDKYHGAHIIIFNESPTKEEMLVASEIALILSNKEAGDILYTQVKNIKKSPNPGEALLSTNSLITLKEIRKETKELLMNSKRFAI